MQGRLFDLSSPDMPPIVHTSDPATSQEAADRVTKSGQRDRNAAIVLRLVRELPGRTATELWDECGSEVRDKLKESQEIRRRLTDLLHSGAVRQEGQRRCRVRGSFMVVWGIAP